VQLSGKLIPKIIIPNLILFFGRGIDNKFYYEIFGVASVVYNGYINSWFWIQFPVLLHNQALRDDPELDAKKSDAWGNRRKRKAYQDHIIVACMLIATGTRPMILLPMYTQDDTSTHR